MKHFKFLCAAPHAMWALHEDAAAKRIDAGSRTSDISGKSRRANRSGETNFLTQPVDSSAGQQAIEMFLTTGYPRNKAFAASPRHG